MKRHSCFWLLSVLAFHRFRNTRLSPKHSLRILPWRCLQVYESPNTDPSKGSVECRCEFRVIAATVTTAPIARVMLLLLILDHHTVPVAPQKTSVARGFLLNRAALRGLRGDDAHAGERARCARSCRLCMVLMCAYTYIYIHIYIYVCMYVFRFMCLCFLYTHIDHGCCVDRLVSGTGPSSLQPRADS